MDNKKVILVVEDNAKNMRLLCDILEAQGYQTIKATNGEEGIDLAREHKPKLIFMDIQMGGINGLEATKALKRSPQTASIPVIAVTALAMKGDREIIMAAGCNDYMAKPIRYDYLVEKLQQWMES